MISGAAEPLVVDQLPSGIWLADLGTNLLRDLPGLGLGGGAVHVRPPSWRRCPWSGRSVEAVVWLLSLTANRTRPRRGSCGTPAGALFSTVVHRRLGLATSMVKEPRLRRLAFLDR